MIIRDFKKEDVEDAIECAEKSFVEQFEVEGHDPEIWRKQARRASGISGRILFGILGILGKLPLRFFVAEVDGKVVGTAMVTKRRNIGYIETVMVHPDYRRRSIAAELMQTAINYVRKRRFAKAILHVSSLNHPARNLYQKLGFKNFDETAYLTISMDSLPSVENIEEIKVRDFKKTDVDAVYELIKSSRSPVWLKVYDFKKTDLKNSLWQRIARTSTAKKIVAEKDGKVVGYASLSYSTAKVAGRISNLEVSLDMVSEGVVEVIFRSAVEYVKPSGTRTLLVTVSGTYEKTMERLEALGFKRRYVMEGMVLE